MENTWTGVEILASSLSNADLNFLKECGLQIADIIQDKGYQGHFCCDAIHSEKFGILLTEINVRPGAEINAHALSEHILGKHYYQHAYVLTRRNVHISDFHTVFKALKSKNLLLTKNNKKGIAFLSFDEDNTGKFEYLIAESDQSSAFQLERHLLELI